MLARPGSVRQGSVRRATHGPTITPGEPADVPPSPTVTRDLDEKAVYELVHGAGPISTGLLHVRARFVQAELVRCDTSRGRSIVVRTGRDWALALSMLDLAEVDASARRHGGSPRAAERAKGSAASGADGRSGGT